MIKQEEKFEIENNGEKKEKEQIGEDALKRIGSPKGVKIKKRYVVRTEDRSKKLKNLKLNQAIYNNLNVKTLTDNTSHSHSKIFARSYLNIEDKNNYYNNYLFYEMMPHYQNKRKK